MRTILRHLVAVTLALGALSVAAGENTRATAEITRDALFDRIYGGDDFYRTLQLAMALGDDADCNAATAGAVVGVRLGFQRLAALPQFKMPDRYVNKTRPQLPSECKVSEQAETLLRIAEKVILANGGERITVGGKPGYRIQLQTPQVLERLPDNPHGPNHKP